MGNSHGFNPGGRSASTLSRPAQGTNGTTLALEKYHGGSYDGYAAPVSDTTQLVILSVREAWAGAQLSAYPNPATNRFHLQLTGATLQNATLTVFDALGRPVRRLPNLIGTTVDVRRDNLAPGTYFFRLTDARGPVAGGRLVWE